MGSSASDSWRIYFLGWLDAMEKLDVVVLELRHLQTTCIHHLRFPDLLDVLRSEETLLAPPPKEGNGGCRDNSKRARNKWKKFAKYLKGLDSRDALGDIRNLTREWVPLFPHVGSIITPEEDLGGSKEDRGKRVILELEIGVRWINGLWGDSRKDLYYILCAAQRMKRQIIADRLLLFMEGNRALGVARPEPESSLPRIAREGPELWIMRMAILSRAQNYLERLGDMQQRLAQHVESMPPEYPHQSIHRRREQGSYTQYLAHRVWQLRRDMKSLLVHLGCKTPGGADDDGTWSPALIMHRWAHGYSSKQGVHLDELAIEAIKDGGAAGVRPVPLTACRAIEVVQTSFWMLDRQENQPIISHEVAHHSLRQYYRNFQLHDLAEAHENDSFAELMRHLFHCLKSFAVPFETKSFEPKTALVNPVEVAADLLAASVNRYAYLFAFVLEVVGWGLEHTMVDEHGYLPHLSVNLELRRDFVASRARHLRDWYVRGRILVAWLRRVSPPAGTLDHWLLDGAGEFLEEINQFLDDATLDAEDKSGFYWRGLADRMASLVDDSDAPIKVKKWCDERRQDNCRIEGQQGPKHALRLPVPIRDMMVGVLRKNGESRSSAPKEGSQADSLETRFKGLRHLDNEDKELCSDGNLDSKKDANRELFKHVYDVPWQCSLMRAEDFLQKRHDVKGVGDLHKLVIGDTSMGRRLFFLAVEVHLNMMQPTYERLGVAMRLLRDGEDLPEAISKWVKEGEDLIKGECTYAKTDTVHRDWQLKQGEHLEALIHHLKHLNRESCPSENLLSIRWLEKYISIHANSDPAARLKRYERMANWFKMEDGNMRMDMVSRFCGVNGTMLPWEKKEEGQGSSSAQAKTDNDRSRRIRTLGQYDLLSFTCDIRPLLRCVLPTFDDKARRGYFQRRETWIAVDLLNRDRGENGNGSLKAKRCDLPAEPLAFLYVQLQRRYFRMDFLTLLADGEIQKDLGLESGDRVFLSHGWADVVIALGTSENRNIAGKLERNALAAVFEIQKLLFQHFLVSRTELVLTDTCLMRAGKAPERFHVEVDVRAQERLLNTRTLDLFMKQVRDNLCRMRPDSNDTQIMITPGKMDVTIILGQKGLKGMEFSDLDEMFKGVGDLIERYETQIGYLSRESVTKTTGADVTA